MSYQHAGQTCCPTELFLVKDEHLVGEKGAAKMIYP
jgi:hypothetical protein